MNERMIYFPPCFLAVQTRTLSTATWFLCCSKAYQMNNMPWVFAISWLPKDDGIGPHRAENDISVCQVLKYFFNGLAMHFEQNGQADLTLIAL